MFTLICDPRGRNESGLRGLDIGAGCGGGTETVRQDSGLPGPVRGSLPVRCICQGSLICWQGGKRDGQDLDGI